MGWYDKAVIEQTPWNVLRSTKMIPGLVGGMILWDYCHIYNSFSHGVTC